MVGSKEAFSTGRKSSVCLLCGLMIYCTCGDRVTLTLKDFEFYSLVERRDSWLSNAVNIFFVLQILSKINHITYRLSQSHDFEKKAFKVCRICLLLAGHRAFTSVETVFIVWI